MYCSNCGNKLMGSEKYCPNCGNNTEGNTQEIISNEGSQSTGGKSSSIVLGILGIIGSILVIFSPISFLLSLIGLIIGIKTNKYLNNKVGIILNAIGLFLSLVSLIIFSLFIYLLFNVSTYRDYDFWDNIPNINDYREDF